MHYSIIIQGKPSNGSFTWDNPYRFNNPYITMIKVLLTPNSDSLFSNIDQTNIVSNDKGESVVFEKGYYTLADIIAMLNQMQYTQYSISNAVSSFGCFHIQSSCSVDFSQAPDIIDILGLTETTYNAGANTGVNIIDITRNRQVIQVYSSIVRTSDLKIANQNNNLITTIIINDPQLRYLNTVEQVNIPIINRFDRIYFSFKDLDGNLMNLNADFELQLTIDDVLDNNESMDEYESYSQFSLSQVCNRSKTEVKLDNPLSFKKCFISYSLFSSSHPLSSILNHPILFQLLSISLLFLSSQEIFFNSMYLQELFLIDWYWMQQQERSLVFHQLLLISSMSLFRLQIKSDLFKLNSSLWSRVSQLSLSFSSLLLFFS